MKKSRETEIKEVDAKIIQARERLQHAANDAEKDNIQNEIASLHNQAKALKATPVEETATKEAPKPDDSESEESEPNSESEPELEEVETETKTTTKTRKKAK